MFKGKRIVSIFTALITLLHVSAPFVLAEEFVITGNGSGANSEVVVQTESSVTIEQSNNTSINNEVDTNANTGGNEITDSAGPSTITTGNIETQVDVGNSMNSSVVNNDCCESEGIELTIDGNGADSSNSINFGSSNETNVSISQNANITNEVNGSGNTGDNKIKDNVGNASITTGNIQVNSKIKNGPVNVEEVSGGMANQSLFASISNNGAGSENLISTLITDLANINTRNTANIGNLVNWDLNTGGNEIEGNVGDASIKTGDIFLNIFIENGPINSGGVDWGCCDTDDPEDPDGEDPDDPGGHGGNGGGDSGGGASFSEILGTGGPAVLGLSNTSAILDNPVVFWLGVMFIVIGIATLGSSLPQRKLRLNEKQERFAK